MVSSADIFEKESYGAEHSRNGLYRAIEHDLNIHAFRFEFYSKNLGRSYTKGISDKEALTATFNDVSITLIRPSASFMFNGPMEMAILEHDGNTIVLTGEIMKRSLSSPTKFFKLSDNNPKQAINDIFIKLAKAFQDIKTEYPNEYERREYIVGKMKPIDDVDQLYHEKVDPLMPVASP